jgi:GntR family transcriptional regulator/MocR family aminotransferase
MKSRLPGALLNLLDQATRQSGLATTLKTSIIQLILDGVIAHHERLPSTRSLANDLKISRDTVEAAYQQLDAAGFLIRRTGSGTFAVSPEKPEAWTRGFNAKPATVGLSRSILPPLSVRGTDIEVAGGVVDQTDIHPFVAAMPDIDSFPLRVWQRLGARIIRSADRSLLMYGDAQGYLPLRDEIWRYLSTYRGVRCDTSQIIVLTSSQQALTLVANLLLNPGDLIGVENPGYHGAKLAFLAAGAFLKPLRIDNEGMVVSEIENGDVPVQAVYVTPSHQYPTGATMSPARRSALLEWSATTGGWIVEDDYDSEYHYEGQPIASLQGVDGSDRVIYLGTFNKVLFPSLRLAYLVVPKPLVKPVVAARTLLDGQSALMSQVILSEFMKGGHFSAHIRHMRMLYKSRRDLFVVNLANHLGEYVTFNPPTGGMSIACFLREPFTEELTVSAATEAKIELPTLRRLYLGGRGPEGWLLGFAALRPEIAERAMALLARTMEDSHKS